MGNERGRRLGVRTLARRSTGRVKPWLDRGSSLFVAFSHAPEGVHSSAFPSANPVPKLSITLVGGIPEPRKQLGIGMADFRELAVSAHRPKSRALSWSSAIDNWDCPGVRGTQPTVP